MKRPILPDQSVYAAYLAATAPTEAELRQQRQRVFFGNPLFSIVCMGGEGDVSAAEDTLRSLQAQTCGSWEFCTVGFDLPLQEAVRCFPDPSARAEQVLAQLPGNWVLFCLPGSRFSPDALYHAAAAAEGADADVLYADTDRLLPDGSRGFPHLKPDYSPHLLRSYPYMDGFFCVRRHLVQQAGTPLSLSPGHRYDYLLRVTEQARRVIHLPRILASLPPEPPLSLSAGCRAVTDALRRCVQPGAVSGGLYSGSFAVQYGVSGEPLVSVILVSRNDYPVLCRTLTRLEQSSLYDRYELIVVNNGSTDGHTLRFYESLRRSRAAKVVAQDGMQNAAVLRNRGAQAARGEALLFLDPGTLPESPGFLEDLLSFAMQPQVGATGPKMVDRQNRIRHAGLVMGLQGWFASPYAGCADSFRDPVQNRFVNTIRNVTALSGACLMTRRSLFQQLGGFDPSFPLSGWDAEYGVRLNRQRLYAVYTPLVRFVQETPAAPPRADVLPRGNLQRCLDVLRPFFTHGDPFWPAAFDPASPTPQLAAPTASAEGLFPSMPK